ncbi:hypothetical protein JAAARDRAFT_59153 [Jaapia argillacea MUCL 33604]|uniref:Isomerase YbhE n=1 Tax=Jaapia argillacea MUCL 33604 TaxID=933084 RepID=A0A067PR07_9AGAM|nr:hypothetical protein JAAARDRAFT_59153 [Jaapia argillacea MUCL 33604]
MIFHILVGSYTNEIYTLAFDPNVPSLKLVSSVVVGHHPSWITPHSTNPSLVYAGLEQPDGKIVAVEYDAEWRGKVVSEVSSGGADPCTLLAYKDELIIGNYSSASVVTLSLNPNPSQLDTSRVLSSSHLTGSGPNPERQKVPHPHQIIIHPEREELLVPDLGSDKVLRYFKTDSGIWETKGFVEYQPGGGPRHVAFYEGVLFTVLELSCYLAAHEFPPLPSSPKLIACLPTRHKPEPHPTGMLAAEILIPAPNKTFTTPYIYVSNRNDPDSTGDTIAIFSASPFEFVAEVSTGLEHLRGMVFGGEDDKWLVAGGVNGHGVKIFERVDGGKGLKEVVADMDIKAPTGFLWV